MTFLVVVLRIHWCRFLPESFYGFKKGGGGGQG